MEVLVRGAVCADGRAAGAGRGGGRACGRACAVRAGLSCGLPRWVEDVAGGVDASAYGMPDQRVACEAPCDEDVWRDFEVGFGFGAESAAGYQG